MSNFSSTDITTISNRKGDEKKEYYQQADITYHIIRATIIRNIKTEERMNPLTPESD